MTSVDIETIDQLLKEWHETKLQIALLEKKCDKYKRYSEKILDNLNKESISGSDFILKRVNMTRNTISKKNVPSDIWNKYSVTSSFSSYYISSKTKSSPKRKKKKSPT